MRYLITILTALVMASPASAHTGIGPTAGFTAGFVHPLGGLDHILTMVAVGLFAYHLGGRALWLVPAAFVAMMAAGGVIGVLHAPLPFVETGIALSAVAVGALVALKVRLPVAAAMAVVGLFALFHGHVHGTEMPVAASGLTYGLGFVAATALLHGAGLGIAFAFNAMSGRVGPALARVSGAVIAVAGLALLGGAV
jgi:urease accessory protein